MKPFPRIHALTLALFGGLVVASADVHAQSEVERAKATGGEGTSNSASGATDSVRSELRRAAQLVGQAKGLKGPARTEALTRAADAYRKILAHHPGDVGSCARAWFEVGELERRKGSLDAAEKAYGQAASLDRDRYGSRALLQRAHMQRRLDRPDEALAAYREVAKIQPASGRAHTARLWVARCLQAKGDAPGAIAAYEAALGLTVVPGRVIELCNGLAKVCLAQGDLDAATAAVARARKVVPEGDGKEAERVRKAFDKMSARRALQRARDKANGAHEDAQNLERERARK